MKSINGPYFDDSGKPILRKSVIVVADILGYELEIEQASRAGTIGKLPGSIYGSLKEAFDKVNDASREKWFTKMMTDNLVMGYPFSSNKIDAEEFVATCYLIGLFQYHMTMHGFPLRGGVCVGDIHLSELLFYPNETTLSELKDAESVSNSPRIILMDTAKRFWFENYDTFPEIDRVEMQDVLWDDYDAVKFINYLRPLSRKFKKERRDWLQCHKVFIEGSLERFANHQRKYLKYIWMAKYHNRFCRSVSDFNSSEYLIDEPIFSNHHNN